MHAGDHLGGQDPPSRPQGYSQSNKNPRFVPGKGLIEVRLRVERVKEIDRFLEAVFHSPRGTGSRESRRVADSSVISVHERGLIVFNHAETRLSDLQKACSTVPGVIAHTARYCVAPNWALGTLIAAFVADLQRLINNEPVGSLVGALGPTFSSPEVITAIRNATILGNMNVADAGVLTADLMGSYERIAEDVFGRGPNEHLILMAEIFEESPDATAPVEWLEALEILMCHIPPNVTIVISGIPKGYAIPANQPHIRTLELDLKGEVGSVQTDGPSGSRYVHTSLETDQPTTKDSIGLRSYALALARFLHHASTKPPLTIGIHGPWGKGKSSFMRMVELYLAHGASQESYPDSSERSAQNSGKAAYGSSSGMLTVTFNAWQYNSAEQVWAGLASQISKGLEQTMPWWYRLRMRVVYAWRNRRTDLVLNVLFPLMAVIALAVWFTIDPTMFKTMWDELKPGKWAAAIGAVGGITVLAGLGASHVVKAVQPVSERLAGYMKMPDHRAQMGYQHRVLADLKFAHERFVRINSQSKVVVFVDDLDRCSDEKIMEILQAVHLILADCGFFVLLSMDTDMIYRAIRLHYAKQSDEGMPENFAENYLRKIVQLSFHLPKTSSEMLFGLASTMFSDDSRMKLKERRVEERRNGSSVHAHPPGMHAQNADALFPVSKAEAANGEIPYDMATLRPLVVVEDVADTPDELAAFEDYREFLADNPREIKRLVNVHRLVKVLLQGDTVWSVSRQRLLVKWLIFQSRWPDLVDDVERIAKEQPALDDCVKVLDIPNMQVEDKERLRAFAVMKNERFSSKHVREFAPAAHLTQMVRDLPPAPKAKETK